DDDGRAVFVHLRLGHRERAVLQAVTEAFEPLLAVQHEPERSYANELLGKQSIQDGRVAPLLGGRPLMYQIQHIVHDQLPLSNNSGQWSTARARVCWPALPQPASAWSITNTVPARIAVPARPPLILQATRRAAPCLGVRARGPSRPSSSR